MAPASRVARLAFGLLFTTGLLLRPSSAQGTCSDDTVCDQGCCSTTGYCGFGPSFCGEGNCTSNCGAVAECGQYAPFGKSDCPLNVCCSQYGFCGTTEEFCDTKCQSGCDPVNTPSCSSSSSGQVSVAYYESWSYTLSCDSWKPENIQASLWTHLNYAFALIDSDYRIASMNSYDPKLYARVTGLKTTSPGLKVYIAVGGWAAGGQVFSDMVSDGLKRSTFIESALAFMDTFGFDGIDIDWEYPAAADRGGKPEDTQNLVAFMEELRLACGSRFGVTMTLPTSYWYLKGFDVAALADNVDWFNFMSYDIHGVWDGDSPYTQRVIQPHTNLTEIQQGLDLLWRNEVDPGKVVLGLALYGRSFTLKDSLCTEPGCAFSDGGKAGSCTKTSGILSNAEIQRIIKLNGLKPTLDTDAAVKYMTWDTDQWVSYDDSETIAMKKSFANQLCLRGTMVWALDLADPSNWASMSNLYMEGMVAADGEQAREYPKYAMAKYMAVQEQNVVDLLMVWTECAPNPEVLCPPGFRVLTTGHGKTFDPDQGHLSGDGCHGGRKGWNRALCIENTVRDHDCAWYGTPGGCNQQCPAGTMLIAKNTHRPDKKHGCKHGRYASFCCKELKADHLQMCDGPVSDDMLSGGLMSRVRLRSQGIFGSMPFPIGTGLECTFRQNGGPQKTYGKNGRNPYIPNKQAWLWNDRGFGRPGDSKPFGKKAPNAEAELKQCAVTITNTVTSLVFGSIKTRDCDYREFPQACQHYSSVQRDPLNPASVLICPLVPRKGSYRPSVGKYERQRSVGWEEWLSAVPDGERGFMGKYGDVCDKDEYPPFRFLDSPVRFTQWIRRVPAWQNRRAGHIWQGVCDIKSKSVLQGGPVRPDICTDMLYVTYTLPRFSMRFRHMPRDVEDGLLTNYCQLDATFKNDPGYALLTGDPWYDRPPRTPGDGVLSGRLYQNTVPAAMKEGKTPPTRGGNALLQFVEEMAALSVEDLIVDDGNVTWLKSEDEIWEQYVKPMCQDGDCSNLDSDLASLAALLDLSSAETAIDEPPVTATAAPTVTAVRRTGKVARPSGAVDSRQASNTNGDTATVAFAGV